MKIGIDARPLIGQRTGIGNYLLGIVRALGRVAGEHTFFLYSPRSLGVELPGSKWHARIYRGVKGTNGTLWLQWYGRRLVEHDEVDVFWGAHFLLPLLLPRRIPAVVTVYDLVPFLYPQTMHWRNLLALRLLVPPSLRRANHVIVISRAAAADLQQVLGVSAERITVIPPGVGPWFTRIEAAEARAHVARTFGISTPYLLAVATLEPRKNLVTVIRAFARLPDQVRRQSALVIAGGAGWRNSALHEEAAPLAAEGTLRFVGYVPDAALPALYAGARALCFPSLYEGFGIPVIEAMACGTPVIAADIPVLREVGSDAVAFVPATEIALWTAAMHAALTTEQFAPLRDRGVHRAAEFTYDRAARNVMRVFTRLTDQSSAMTPHL